MQNILFLVKKYAKDLVLFLLIIICIGLIGYNFYHDEESDDNDVEPIVAINDEIKEEEPVITKLNVDVKGAVKTPGVYEVDNGAIVNDVVKMAGGFNSNAYKNGINLSKKVTDEMVIYVYTKTEIKEKEEKEDSKNEDLESCNEPTYDIYDCIKDNNSVIEVKPDTNKDNNINESTDNDNSGNDNTIININKASKSELMSIKGIGEAKADAIIEYRTQNGLFNSINDLLNVNGIGEALLDKIKEFITV